MSYVKQITCLNEGLKVRNEELRIRDEGLKIRDEDFHRVLLGTKDGY